MARATFRLTVPQDLYDAVSDECGQEFADSYLTGATLAKSQLLPRTRTGFAKMMDRADFKALLKHLNIVLVRPDPFPGDGTRLHYPDVY